MAGGKGGSTTSSVTIPEYIEEAARRNLAKAEGISQIGYVPYFGPDVAAFTPFQQAGFQQTADVASAFGLGTPTTQADIMGGMPEPTQFAGGVRGYSAAPLYQQAVDELAAQRPAQAQYIESFFIDPVTGQAGTRVQPAVDYSTMGTMADIRAADRANELAIAQAQAAAGPQNVTFETTSFAANPNLAVQPNDQIFNIAPPEVQIAQQIMATDPTNPQYNEAFQTVYDYQAAQAAQDPTGQSTGLGITPEIIDATGVDAFLPPTLDPNAQASSLITNPAEGITDTSTASLGTQLLNDITEGLTGMASNTLLGQVALGDSYNVGGVNNPIETPTVAEMIAAAPPNMVYDASTGAYLASSNDNDTPIISTPASDSGNFLSGGGADGVGDFGAVGDFFGSIGDALGITDYAGEAEELTVTPAAATAPPVRPTSSDSDSGGSGGGGGGCVVATHAVSSGAFTPRMKREAVVWCMDKLHGKWWGEAIRRGYRHLGSKKIAEGKAHNHYSEFRDYIDFARGKKRTIMGGIHFAARTTQFFVVGLVRRSA
jgi:hypothetical protein